MLNGIIRFSLNHRLLIVVLSLAVMVLGSMATATLPIDVLPDLTRPRVVLITECPGYAPEEVETLVTFPLETTLIGAAGVTAVRSASDIGLSVIKVDFDWNQEIYTARQIVQERIAMATDRLPEGIRPQMGPISSLLGQIMLIGMWSRDGTTDALELRTQADWVVRRRLLTIPGISQVITIGGGRKQYQVLVDPHALHKYDVSLHEVKEALRTGNLNVTGGYLRNNARELLVRGLGRVGQLARHGIECSMSSTGNCYDNAVVESFFGALKRERVNRVRYRTRDHARADLFDYIEVFYNRKRRHSYVQPQFATKNRFLIRGSKFTVRSFNVCLYYSNR